MPSVRATTLSVMLRGLIVLLRTMYEHVRLVMAITAVLLWPQAAEAKGGAVRGAAAGAPGKRRGRQYPLLF